MRTAQRPSFDFSWADDPSEQYVADLRRRFPVEPEIDRMLTRKMRRRAGPGYRRISLPELVANVSALLEAHEVHDYEVTDPHWLTGGVSKIQMGFRLSWRDPVHGPRRRRLVVRMDPSEGSNATSRAREWETLRALAPTVPVPEVAWLDRDGEFFPEPALVYAFVDGVTKPTGTSTGRITGIGTDFAGHRDRLAPQFVTQLGAIHALDVDALELPSFARPRVGTTDAVRWRINQIRRIWEEDRGEDFPLLEVAVNWLERHAPVLDHVSVVHGDYRSGNFLFDEGTGQITAWLDWERGYLGDRHHDLAWTSQIGFGHYADDGRYLVCGLVPIDEFFTRYEDASGLSVDPGRLHYYRVLISCLSLCSTIGAAYRVPKLGKSHQDVLVARLRGMAPIVAAELIELLEDAS